MKAILSRLSKLEVKCKTPELPPVFVTTLDELDPAKLYSIVFCESEEIHATQVIACKTLLYGHVQ